MTLFLDIVNEFRSNQVKYTAIAAYYGYIGGKDQ